MNLKTLAIVSTMAIASLTGAYAAVPVCTTPARQDSAPEALEVTVLSVKGGTPVQTVVSQPNCIQTRQEFTVTAKVDVVRRSASGMQPGRTIAFRHSTIRTGPCALPDGNFGAALNGGDRVQAYLRPALDGGFLALDLKKLP